MHHREFINWLAENSFVEHKARSYNIRVHIKGNSEEFTNWVDFPYSPTESPWCALERAGIYEVVILEWLVNVYSKRKITWREY